MYNQDSNSDQISHKDSIRRSFRVIFIFFIISLIIVSENNITAHFDIYDLLIVSNAILILPFLSIYILFMHSSHRKTQKNITNSRVLWGMPITLIVILNLYIIEPYLFKLYGLNIAILFAIIVLVVIIMYITIYRFIVKPSVIKVENYDIQLSNKYNNSLSSKIGRNIRIFITQPSDPSSTASSTSDHGNLLVYINKNFLDKMDDREIEALLMHEAGHHIGLSNKFFRIAPMPILVSVYIFIYIYLNLFKINEFISMIIYLALLISIPFSFKLLKSYLESYEYKADKYCVDKMGDKTPLISLLEKAESFQTEGILLPEIIKKHKIDEINKRIWRISYGKIK